MDYAILLSEYQSIVIFYFSTLYTTISQAQIKYRLTKTGSLYQSSFLKEEQRYMYLIIGRDKS
jgi:hypothetical protein